VPRLEATVRLLEQQHGVVSSPSSSAAGQVCCMCRRTSQQLLQAAALRDALLRLFGAHYRKTVVNSDSVTAFKSRMKTFLFSRAFSLPFSQ